jgi:hypothetical protein
MLSNNVLTTTIKATEVRSMKLSQLKTVAAQMNIVIDENDKKWVILEIILKALETQRVAKKSTDIMVDQQIVTMLADESITKSDKIRHLYGLAYNLTAMSALVGAHYSFVHGVVQKCIVNEKIEALTLPAPIVMEKPVIETVLVNPNFDIEVPQPKAKVKKKTAAEKLLEEVYA